MKKIVNIMFAVAGFLALAPAAFAQTSSEGIVLAKTVTQEPDANGVRWITLESFVTGSVKVVTASMPSDVLLVLDVSTSMNKNYYTYTAQNEAGYSYNSIENSSSKYYYNYDGSYYEVKADRSGNNNSRRYYLYFTANSTSYYLSGTGVTTTQPTTVTNNSATIWTGILYKGDDTRLEALKEAALGFVDIIKENAESASAADPTYAGNRIGIITFGGSDSTEDKTGGWKNAVTDYSSLTSTITGLNVGSSGTWTSSGLRIAYENYLQDTAPNTPRNNANLTVVVFTDGEPATGGQSNSSVAIDGKTITSDGPKFSSYIANNSVYYASLIKALKNDYNLNAKVFTIALLGSDADSRVEPFVDILSSDYPDATATFQSEATWTYNDGTVTATGLVTGQKKSSDFYQLVGENDLSSIFENIAQQSGGSASSITEDAVVEVDVVSNSFSLPSGGMAEGYVPKIYVAKCTGYDSEGKGNTFAVYNNDDNVFGSSTLNEDYWIYIENKDNNMINVDDSESSITIGVNNNEISTFGFDFAKNWCGRRSADEYKTTENPEGYYAGGYKLIVQIPIVVSESAVGGAGTQTNEEGSGIWVDGVLVAKFPIPTITLPTNLWVMKSGLAKYENAHFFVYRKEVVRDSDGKVTGEGGYVDVDSNGDPVPYTSFILTGGLNEQTLTAQDGNSYTGPVIKLQGLSSDYFYEVKELEDWSWQYQGQAKTPTSTYKLTANPVVIVNNQLSTSVLHAESKVANDFMEATAKSYSSKHYTE